MTSLWCLSTLRAHLSILFQADIQNGIRPGLSSALTEAGNKGIGIIAMKTCSGGKYSPSPDVVPGFPEAVRWVIQHSYISSAAVAMANFEQVNEHAPLLAG